MPESIEDQNGALEPMTTSELVEHFAEVHGYPCRTRHRQYLIRKIALRIQANAGGDLSRPLCVAILQLADAHRFERSKFLPDIDRQGEVSDPHRSGSPEVQRATLSLESPPSSSPSS